ncbi:MAG TPA: methyl-accepting chemotaxis protein [Candidatus Baltobacteraceae bacterium]|jgi:methyl-accepting chemotaxis protein
MKNKSVAGIRIQILLLTIVPLAFLVLTLVLLLGLVRTTLKSTQISEHVTRVLQESDLITQGFDAMSRSTSLFAKTHNRKDLAGSFVAQRDVADQQNKMLDLVANDPVLKPEAERYVKDTRAVVALFITGRQLLEQNRMKDVAKLITSPSSKALGTELEGAKAALSTKAAAIAFALNVAGNRAITVGERVLLLSAAVGIFSTLVLALLFGLRFVRRLGNLADNARRLAAGEAAEPLRGSDEITELDRIYRQMFEMAREAKLRLQHSVRSYGLLAGWIAEGNLSARVTVENPDDELGQLGTSLNAMAESLERLVGEIRRAATSLASASSQILAATSQQVSSATEEAAAVRQTAVTVMEVRQTAEVSSQKTKMVAELAQRVRQTAEDGKLSVEQSVRGSEAAKERMEILAERIIAFSEQAQAIAEINATVATLAEQSNLLAVNAGIEAAKAGEAGRGFAVVAGEVKELGSRSKEATVQVRRIVSDIQRSAQNAVLAAEQGMKVADSGMEVAKRSGQAMEILATSIGSASDAAQQISASAAQQEIGMDQIAVAMQSIEQASMQSVAATQQVEHAAHDLTRLAQKLTETIERHVRVNGVGEKSLIKLTIPSGERT